MIRTMEGKKSSYYPSFGPQAHYLCLYRRDWTAVEITLDRRLLKADRLAFLYLHATPLSVGKATFSSFVFRLSSISRDIGRDQSCLVQLMFCDDRSRDDVRSCLTAFGSL